MDKLKYTFFSLFSIFMLSSCTSLKLAPQDVENIDRIGVVAILGNHYSFVERGMLGVGSSHTYDITDWRIDQKTQEIFARHLAKRPYKYKYVDYDHSYFLDKYNNDGEFFGTRFKEEFIEIMSKNDVNTLIVVSRHQLTFPHGFGATKFGKKCAQTMWLNFGVLQLQDNKLKSFVDYESVSSKLPDSSYCRGADAPWDRAELEKIESATKVFLEQVIIQAINTLKL